MAREYREFYWWGPDNYRRHAGAPRPCYLPPPRRGALYRRHAEAPRPLYRRHAEAPRPLYRRHAEAPTHSTPGRGWRIEPILSGVVFRFGFDDPRAGGLGARGVAPTPLGQLPPGAGAPGRQ
jgi:hypothetical protein